MLTVAVVAVVALSSLTVLWATGGFGVPTSRQLIDVHNQSLEQGGQPRYAVPFIVPAKATNINLSGTFDVSTCGGSCLAVV